MKIDRRTLIVAFAALAFLSPLPAWAQDKDGAEPPATRPAGNADELYREPDQPLDPRGTKGKVTEQEPPPLPELVILPMPPSFRIATHPQDVPIIAPQFERARAAIDRGLSYLQSRQDEVGGWLTAMQTAPTDQPQRPSPIAVAVTAMAVKATVQARPDALNDPHLRLGLRYVLSAKRPDGSFDRGALANYVNASVASALAAVDSREFHDELRETVQWLTTNQWDQSEGLSARQDWFGGAGYGNRGRPDLSNTQMMVEAMYDAGMSPDEPAMQRALAFVARAQNLKATNKAEWAGNDGGFVYTPANGGESFASETAEEGRYGEKIPAGQPRSLRSYGSMTYAGFKSMLYAGLSPDDIRVRAAFDWIRRNWTFDANPGLGQDGLYYYYHAMSRALHASQQTVITDIDGEKHNWREELIDAILARQREDGSWRNKSERWLEGEPVMATIHSLLALEEALKPVAHVE